MKAGKKNFQGELKSGGNYFHPQNLLLNGNFEYWYAGASSAPDGWALNAITVARSSTKKFGNYACQITGDGADAYHYVWQELSNYADYKGKQVTVLVWVYQSSGSAQTCGVRIWDGVGFTDTEVSVANTTWTLLTVTHTVDNSATLLRIILLPTSVSQQVSTNSAIFDGVMLVEGSTPFAYQLHFEDHLYEQITKWINGSEVYYADSGSPNFDYIDGWSSVTGFGGIYYHFPVPFKIKGKAVIVDEINIYYNTVSAVGGEDFITDVYLRDNDLDGSRSNQIAHTGDIGNGSNGDGSHNIVDTPYEVTDYPKDLGLNITGTDAVTDVKIRGIQIKYHAKVHG